jgi:hypothetical protein
MSQPLQVTAFHVSTVYVNSGHVKKALAEQVPERLLLTPRVPATFADPFEPLKAWLQNINEFSQIQPEQGADWIQIRFYFQTQPFCLHYEHYSDCYWIDADSQASLVLLSQLAGFIASIEHNHRLSQP